MLSVPGLAAEYDEAIRCVQRTARAMEQGARDLRPYGENPLRRTAIMGLSDRFQGRVSAETLNAAGRSDVLVRAVDGGNVLVGECKLWGGQLALRSALTQLLGYATPHDRGLLLLLFVRIRSVREAVEKTETTLRTQNGVRQLERDGRDDQLVQVVVAHPADSAVDALVSIAFVALPDERSDAVGGAVSDTSGLSDLAGFDEATLVGAHQPEETPETEQPSRGATDSRTGRLVAHGEQGRRAMLLLDDAMRWHIGVQITEGMRIVFDQVPPEFAGTAKQLAQAQRPIIDLQPAPDWSWPIVLHVRTDRGELDVPMSLYEVPPEAGYDHTLRGVFHNLSFSMSQHKKLDGTVDSNYHWRLHPSQLPARDRLAALDFLYACSGRGELQLESSVPELPSTTMGMDGDDLDRSLLVDRAFFSDLVAVEDWTNDRFRVPESASAEEVHELARAAATIRARRCTVLWEGSTWRLPRVDAPRVGRREEEPIPMAVESEIFGKVVQLGFATGTARYEVTAVEDIPHESDHVAVTITPQDERSKVVPVEDLQPLEPHASEPTAEV